ATGGKSGNSADGAASVGMFGMNIQIDDGTVTATGSEEVNELKTSIGIYGAANVKLNGGNINAKGKTTAIAAATTNGLVIDDIANVKVNDKLAKVGKITIDEIDSSTLVDDTNAIIKDAAIKFKLSYKGENPLAPNAAKATRTHDTITLETKTIAGETVEYGKKNADGTILWQDSPIFDGLTAGTPYTFYSRVKTNDTHKAGATSAETIIRTKTVPVSVSGTVKDSDNSPLVGATVQLKQGITEVQSVITVTDGKYSFADVPEGVYSLVITKGTGKSKITITDSVTVKGSAVNVPEMKFLDGKKNTVVESKPGTPEVAVGGLNDLLNTTNLNTTLEKPKEQTAVTNGGTVDLTFTATSTTAADDNGKLEELATTNGEKIDMLLDLSVYKTVKEADGTPVTMNEKITELAGFIQVHLPIPEELQGRAGLSLYRMHGVPASAEKLTEGVFDGSKECYTIDASKTFMTLYLNKFSTYAMGCKTYDVTITGASGTGKYAAGDVVTINAGSKSGYTFDSWTVNAGGVTLANANSATTTFVMPAGAVTLTANWTYTGGGTGGNPGGNPSPEVYYYINATTSRGGSINTPERVKVIAGGSASFTITPDKGYQIADVLVNGNSIGAKNSYVFTNVNSDQTIHATFKKAGHRNPQTGVDVEEG
ncbi:MAG: carboxypeptidase regulatory-like domain-containing protein, partial [Oscillospiraceae bacterium]